MPRERALSGLEGREPHSLSLKVLRLSRPFCINQFPIPPRSNADTQEILHLSKLSHSYPSASEDDTFILTPLLALPPAFGSAYVGEQFTCCLCAHNNSEVDQFEVKMSAQMQTPSMTVDLVLSADGIDKPSNPTTSTAAATSTAEKSTAAAAPVAAEPVTSVLTPKETIQRVVKHDLKEEGNHVLSVTLSYNEPSSDPEGYRTRTFRKLYQFVVQQCLTVRTKTSEAPTYTPTEEDGVSAESQQQSQQKSILVLEAQLENMGESPITLETVNLHPRKGWVARSLNWDKLTSGGIELGGNKDGSGSGIPADHAPLMKYRDIIQVAFLIEVDPQVAVADRKDEPSAQLKIEWRSACGDRGFLSTGYLTARKKG